jgi:hypothetical protein
VRSNSALCTCCMNLGYKYITILVPKSRMRGAIPPLPNTSSHRGTLLSNAYGCMGSRDRSVGIALGYGLNDRGSRVRSPAGNFSLHRVQNGSGAHPASYLTGTRGSFLGGEADRSPPSSAEVKE